MKIVYMPFEIDDQGIIEWLNENIGNTIGYMEEGGKFGVGWELYLTPENPPRSDYSEFHWAVVFKNDNDATFFELAWD
jgi:PAS domain-containing protein